MQVLIPFGAHRAFHPPVPSLGMHPSIPLKHQLTSSGSLGGQGSLSDDSTSGLDSVVSYIIFFQTFVLFSAKQLTNRDLKPETLCIPV